MPESERKAKQAQNIVSQISQGDFSPEVFALGEPVTQFQPFLNMNGASRVELNVDSLDILVGFPEPTKEEVDSLFDNIDISLFVYRHVPFLILHTDKFTVDMNINIRKMKPEYIDDWLDSKCNTVRIIFVDALNMKLVGLRSIQLPLMKQVREALKEEAGYEKEEIDIFASMAMKFYSTQDMLKAAKAKNKFGHCNELDFFRQTSDTSADDADNGHNDSEGDSDKGNSNKPKSPWHDLFFETIFQIVIVLFFVFLPKVFSILALACGVFQLVYSIKFIKDEKQSKGALLFNAFCGFLFSAFGIVLLLDVDLLKVIILATFAFSQLIAVIYKTIKEKKQILISFLSLVVTLAACGYLICRIV